MITTWPARRRGERMDPRRRQIARIVCFVVGHTFHDQVCRRCGIVEHWT